MDTGTGKFEQVQQTSNEIEDIVTLMKALEEMHPDHGGWFQEGEIVELRGSTFRVKSVKPTELRLKLLKRGAK